MSVKSAFKAGIDRMIDMHGVDKMFKVRVTDLHFNINLDETIRRVEETISPYIPEWEREEIIKKEVTQLIVEQIRHLFTIPLYEVVREVVEKEKFK